MSTAPDDLLDGLPDADVLAAAVEEHLDAHPLPVDDAEAARAAARLQQRIQATQPAPARPWALLALGMAAAALALFALATWSPTSQQAGTEEAIDDAAALQVAPELRVVTVPAVHTLAERPLRPDEGTVLLTSEQGTAGAMLVQKGRAELGGTEVPEAHWAVIANSDAGVVVFPDGTAPPDDLPEEVEAQLDDLRWRVLPPRTLDALDRLLEEPGSDRADGVEAP